MSDFKVGEILVGQNHIINTEKNGMECEVIGDLVMRTGYPGGLNLPPETKLQYLVRWANGQEWNACPQYLRRRKPPTTGEQSIMSLLLTTPQREGAPA